MAKKSDVLGKQGELLAMGALRARGFLMPEQISTPVKLIPHPKAKGYFRVVYGEKVSGDTRAVLPGGISVLIETKTIFDRNLRWGDLSPHQPGRLDRHAEEAVSLLAWVFDQGVQLMRWPVPGFAGSGDSIRPEEAVALNIWSVKDLTELGGEK
jgi:hypothetical protein